jgi:ketosteroid isomerase-like protein
VSQENVEIVRDHYAATNERDFARAMSHYGEGVEMIVPSGITAGVFRGKAAVGDWFGDWFATFDRDARFDLEEVVAIDESSVLLVAQHHATGRSSGAEVNEQVVWVYRLAAGKIIHVRRYDDRAEALTAVGMEG